MSDIDQRPPSPGSPPAAPTHGGSPIQEDDWERRKGYTRLALAVAAVVVLSSALGAVKTVAVIAAVLLMIMLHELGHFATAKWSGMKVTEYFLGFGPRIWSIRKGETEYGIKAIPAGGYVKIIGMSNLEEVDPADEQRTYRAKPYPNRLAVAVAGSTVHFILAFVLLIGLLVGPGLDTGAGIGSVLRPGRDPLPEVGALTALDEEGKLRSPAQRAGFEVGDRIVSVDGEPIDEWAQVPELVRPKPDQRVRFVVERDGRRVQLTATPLDLSSHPAVPEEARADEPTGFVGISPAYPVEREPLLSAVPQAAADLWDVTKLTAGALAQIFSPSGVAAYVDSLGGGAAAEDPDTPRFLSPVGLVRVAGETAESGIRDVLVLLIAINVFVGMFNMVPLPPLDGGHVAIATYEAIRSRRGRPYRVDMMKVMPITYAVFALLVMLGLTSLFLDIVRPLQLG